MQGNAATLGRIAGMLANGGRLSGYEPLLSQKALDLALSEPKFAFDHFMKCRTSFTKGGFCDFRTFDAGTSNLVDPSFHRDMDGFVGWGGFGGSLFIWNPERRLGMAYVMNGLALNSLGGPRTDRIMRTIQAILKKI